jgi:hypothetical protein
MRAFFFAFERPVGSALTDGPASALHRTDSNVKERTLGHAARTPFGFRKQLRCEWHPE